MKTFRFKRAYLAATLAFLTALTACGGAEAPSAGTGSAVNLSGILLAGVGTPSAGLGSRVLFTLTRPAGACLAPRPLTHGRRPACHWLGQRGQSGLWVPAGQLARQDCQRRACTAGPLRLRPALARTATFISTPLTGQSLAPKPTACGQPAACRWSAWSGLLEPLARPEQQGRLVRQVRLAQRAPACSAAARSPAMR